MSDLKGSQVFPPPTMIKDDATQKWAKKFIALMDEAFRKISLAQKQKVESHAILSSDHSDTTTSTVVRGDVMVGNSTPYWSRLAAGASGKFLRSDGTDPSWSVIGAGDLPSSIDAAKISGGTVSNTEFDYLNGVTSAIQTQLNAKQALDAELTALAGLTSAADKLPYFTGSGTANVTDLTSFARTILDDANEATFKATVNLEIGTDVLAYDAGLSNLAGVAMAANKFYYTTADNTHVAADVTSFARSILDDADEATFKATVNLEIGTDVLAQQTIGIADDNLLEVDGTPNSGEYARFTAAGLEGRTEAEFKGDFNLEIGTDVQAQGAVLDDFNTLGAPASDGQFIVATGAGAFAYESGATARTSIGLGTSDTPTFAGLITTDSILMQRTGAQGYIIAYDTTLADYTAFSHDGTKGNILTNAGNLTIAPAGGTTNITGILAATGNVTGANLNISNWDTAYSHSQDNSQAHSDYLINNGNDTMNGDLTTDALNTGNIDCVGFTSWNAGKTIRLTFAKDSPSAGIVSLYYLQPSGTVWKKLKFGRNLANYGLTSDASTGYVGFGDDSPDAPVHITNLNTVGVELLHLEQKDQDKPFIDFDGTEAADTTKNITTLGSLQDSDSGIVVAPDSTNWDCGGLIKMEVSGVEYWMAYYDTV